MNGEHLSSFEKAIATQLRSAIRKTQQYLGTKRMVNLMNPFTEAYFNVDSADLAWAVENGISRDQLYRGPALFGVAGIETAERTFQIVDGELQAVIIPVSDSYDIGGFEDGFVDLLAFYRDDPARWWVYRDSAPLINLEAISRTFPFMDCDEVLIVHETPLDWLRHNREGIVIIDWSSDLRPYLCGVRRILAGNEALAQRLETALREPPVCLPEIRFLRSQDAA